MPLWKAFEQTLEFWLQAPPTADSALYARKNQSIHAKLEELLKPSDISTVELATGLIERLSQTIPRVRLAKRSGS